MDGIDVLDGAEAAGDDGLVRAADGEVFRRVDGPHGFEDGVLEHELVGLRQETNIAVQRAVAVEEDGFLRMFEVPLLRDGDREVALDGGEAFGGAGIFDVFGRAVAVDGCAMVEHALEHVFFKRAFARYRHIVANAAREQEHAGVDDVLVVVAAAVVRLAVEGRHTPGFI